MKNNRKRKGNHSSVLMTLRGEDTILVKRVDCEGSQDSLKLQKGRIIPRSQKIEGREYDRTTPFGKKNTNYITRRTKTKNHPYKKYFIVKQGKYTKQN